MTKENEEQTEFFPVTSICRDDIEHQLKRKDLNFTDLEMKWIARKMADDYLNQLYWSSLEFFAQSVLDDRERRR